MSDDQQGWRSADDSHSAPPTGGWGGEYDGDATSFVQMPSTAEQFQPGMTGEGMDYSPLAAPGTGAGWEPPAIPPMTPAASTDPTATGVWTMPFASGEEPYQAATSHPSPEEPQRHLPHTALGQGAAAALAGAHEARTPTGDHFAPSGEDQGAGGEFGTAGYQGGGPSYATPAAYDPLDPSTPLDLAATQGGGYDDAERRTEVENTWGAVERNPLWTPPSDGEQPASRPEFTQVDYQPADPGGYGAQEPPTYQEGPAPSLPEAREGDEVPGGLYAQQPGEAWLPEARDGRDGANPLGGTPAVEHGFVPRQSEPVADVHMDPPPAPESTEPATAEPVPDQSTEPAPHAEPAPPPDVASEQADTGPVDAPAPEPAPVAEDAEPVQDSEHPLESYVLHVNGMDRPVADAWIGESLLYVLRERLGLAGAKDGCSQGECGACSVQVDGRLVASCLVPAVTAAESEVRTVEGLSKDGEPSDVQRTLAERAGANCGFCVPGMAMTVHDLLEGNHAPSELEVRRALCGNLCRCSGYRGVLEAVQEVARSRAARLREQQAAAQQAGAPQEAADPQQPRIPQQARTEEPGGEQ